MRTLTLFFVAAMNVSAVLAEEDPGTVITGATLISAGRRPSSSSRLPIAGLGAATAIVPLMAGDTAKVTYSDLVVAVSLRYAAMCWMASLGLPRRSHKRARL